MTLKALILAAVLIGHWGLALSVHNRLHATGLGRNTIKCLSKLFLLFFLALFLFVLGFHRKVLMHWLVNEEVFPLLADWLLVYGLLCMSVVVAMGPLWLGSRFGFEFPRDSIQTVSQRKWKVANEIQQDVFASSLTRTLGSVPGNQIGCLEYQHHRVYFPNLPDDLVGIKIAHLSDLHLTGRMADGYYRFAFQALMSAKPDLVVLSGDILDYGHQLATLDRLIPDLKGKFGEYFVLGNHDRRLKDPSKIRMHMLAMHWRDLGTCNHCIQVGASQIHLWGNEAPWFPLPDCNAVDPVKPPSEFAPGILRLAVSHSPDQWKWAVGLNADLLLAGHTHGGQVRFPVIGPLVAPSNYGSRYASGWFQRKNTLMHVSRGLSGLHPFRFRCLPEITLLELQARTHR